MKKTDNSKLRYILQNNSPRLFENITVLKDTKETNLKIVFKRNTKEQQRRFY